MDNDAVLDTTLKAQLQQIAASPQARFPFLTTTEMEHLAWFAIYFGDREMAVATDRYNTPPPMTLSPLFDDITRLLIEDRYGLAA